MILFSILKENRQTSPGVGKREQPSSRLSAGSGRHSNARAHQMRAEGSPYGDESTGGEQWS